MQMPGSNDLWWMIIDVPMPNLSSKTYSHAEREMRSAAHDYVAVLKESIEGFQNAYLVQTGPQIGIRESRYPKARYLLTADDPLTGRLREDGVARAAWPAEVHADSGTRFITPWAGQAMHTSLWML